MAYTFIFDGDKADIPFPVNCGNAYISSEETGVRVRGTKVARIGDPLNVGHPYLIAQNPERSSCRVRIGNIPVALKGALVPEILTSDFVESHNHGSDSIPASKFSYSPISIAARVNIGPS